MCRIEERNYDCGHYKETIFFCTKKRYDSYDPCRGGGRQTVASQTGSKCGWDGCDNKIKLKREGPRGKPDVLLPLKALVP
jgi:hypothetical protein